MKTKLKLFAVLLITVVAVAVHGAQEVLTVAVFDFESKDENVRDLGPKVATLLNATLLAEPNLILVERAELEKVLGEQELGLSGTVSPDTAAKVGTLTGAKVLVTGRVFKVDKETMVVAKIISTETSRVYGEMVKGTAAVSISDLSGDLAKKIAATVTQKGETLVAKVETREERMAKIKARKNNGDMLTVDRQTSVAVDIAEQTAAKTSLQNAACELAERLLPKLSN